MHAEAGPLSCTAGNGLARRYGVTCTRPGNAYLPPSPIAADGAAACQDACSATPGCLSATLLAGSEPGCYLRGAGLSAAACLNSTAGDTYVAGQQRWAPGC